MTDLEKLKKQVQGKEFPVGAKIKEGCIEIEVLNSIQEDGDMTIFLECNDCIFNDGICKGDISCSNFDREDNECVIFKQTTNGN